jgi:hypothetical protein
MTEWSALSELVRFVGSSSLANANDAQQRQAVNGMAAGLSPRARRSVGDLLGAVLALSARTRRMVLPRVAMQIDVYRPDGQRAVDLTFGS